MGSFCLLTAMELIPTPNCSALYLHSNNIDSLKSSIQEKKKFVKKKKPNNISLSDQLINQVPCNSSCIHKEGH